MPLPPEAIYVQPLMAFMLILCRLGGLFQLAPLLGSRTIPVRIRAFLALALSVILTPLFLERVPAFEHWGQFGLLAGREFILGLILGFSTQVMFAGIQLAGQIVGQMSGMQMADLFDPNFDQSISVFARLFDLTTTAVFLLIGGHRQLMGVLMELYRVVPPGGGTPRTDLFQFAIQLTGQSFALGLRAAAPIMMAVLLSVLVMGLISRTLPQLNILAVGFSLNSVVVLAMILLSIGTIGWILEAESEATLQALHDLFSPSASP